MDATAILDRLRTHGLAVTVANGQDLRVSPKGNLTDELRAVVRANKAKILAHLESEATPSASWKEDPRPDLNSDSPVWVRLLRLAFEVDGDTSHGLFQALHGLRCGGARLVGDGNRLRLAGGDLGDEYPALRETWLLPHRETLSALLERTRADEAHSRNENRADAIVHWPSMEGE